MPTITLESSERSKRKNRLRSTRNKYGTRHGDGFWEEERKRDNFGLKYMQKLGWNKGDGLGASRQGQTTMVKAKYKNDTKGIGSKSAANDDMFKATMCMFNDILSGLNAKKKGKDSAAKSATPTGTTTSAIIRSYEAKHHLLSVHLLALSDAPAMCVSDTASSERPRTSASGRRRTRMPFSEM